MVIKRHASNNHMPLEIDQVSIKIVTPLWALTLLEVPAHNKSEF